MQGNDVTEVFQNKKPITKGLTTMKKKYQTST